MKKLTLIPKKDTITICLPPDWVGKKIFCYISSAAETESEETRYCMAAEPPMQYNAKKTVQKRKKRNKKQMTNEVPPQSNA